MLLNEYVNGVCMKKKINTKISSLFSFFTLLFVLLLLLSFQGSLTGRAVFVLDDDVTADQIATIATLAGPGDETKMLSEVSLDAGGYIIFSELDDGDSAIIKESGGNIYVHGNLEDAAVVIKNSDYNELLEEYGILEIVNGEIVKEVEEKEITATCSDASGKVTVTYSDGKTETESDSCSGLSFVDATCSSENQIRKIKYSCSYSCSASSGCSANMYGAAEVLESGGVDEMPPAVTSASCVDSDGGYVKETAGVTTYGFESYTDACSSEMSYSSRRYTYEEKWYVTEGFCYNGGYSVGTEKVYCGDGYTCFDGACVSKTTSAANVQIFSSTVKEGVSSYPSCKTTDLGIDYSVSSTGKVSYTNSCSGNTEFRYVCTADNTYALIQQSCSEGCTAGKGCNEGYVAKSDATMTKTTFIKDGQSCNEDQNKNVWGVDSSGTSFSYQDYCLSAIYVKEFGCTADYDYGTNMNEIRLSEGNTVCENGCDTEKKECRTERVDLGQASCAETVNGVTGTDYVGRSYTYETRCDTYYTYDTTGQMFVLASQTTAYCDATTQEPKSTTVYCGDNQENMGVGYACGLDGSCISADDRPKVSSCFDPDGLDKNSFGTVTVYDADGAMTSYSDRCTTENGKDYVMEQYCGSSSTVAQGEIACDSFCLNGVCDTMSASCEDSDGGIDASTSGVVQYYTASGEGGMGYDECTGDKTLTEWYCDENKAQSETIQCKEFCYGTVCDTMSLECSDTERGADPAVVGYLTYYSLDGTITPYEDTCSADGKTVTDWYCDGKDVKSQAFTCDGYCSYGSCTAAQTTLLTPITTVDEFFASTQDWYYDMKIVIPSKGSTQDYLAALALVGKYGYPLVKDTDVSDYRTLHAIVVGGPSVNTVSKAVIEAGASREGVYYVYQDSTYYGTVLVVGSDDSKETRKAVKELMKK